MVFWLNTRLRCGEWPRPAALCPKRRILNFSLCTISYMVWRRCDPDFPLKIWLPCYLASVALVPALRVHMYKVLNVPYIFASAAFTSTEYKHAALIFYVFVLFMNLLLPYGVHFLSKNLQRGQYHFTLFGLVICGFAMFCMHAEFYVRRCFLCIACDAATTVPCRAVALLHLLLRARVVAPTSLPVRSVAPVRLHTRLCCATAEG